MTDNNHRWRLLRWWNRLNTTMTALHDRLGTSPAAVVALALIAWCMSAAAAVALLMISPNDPGKRPIIIGGFASWTFVIVPSLVAYRLRVLRAQAIEARRRSGCCPSCGYDLRASPERCPECGEPKGTVDEDE
jgi:hypothetical protein